jgi:two-component system LytT family response regulator
MQALIIDDEHHCREGLSIMLSLFCPGVEVLAQCASARTGLQAIERFHPDLIFLDIEMPGMSGFEMLENCKEYGFEIIFTTAYNEYAIQAIRHSALDYLLKPVDKDELVQAVARARTAQQHPAPRRIQQLLETVDPRLSPERIALTTLEGLIIIELKDILYCESEKNYTRFHLSGPRVFIVSKTLKRVEQLLQHDANFFRIHHSYIINMRHLQRYIRGDGGEIGLSNGKLLPVSRTKKQEFLARLETL